MNQHIERILNVIATPDDCISEDVFFWHARVLSDLADHIEDYVCSSPTPEPVEGVDIDTPAPECSASHDEELILATLGVVEDVIAMEASPGSWSWTFLVHMHDSIAGIIRGGHVPLVVPTR
jgi:hypothetical protein